MLPSLLFTLFTTLAAAPAPVPASVSTPKCIGLEFKIFKQKTLLPCFTRVEDGLDDGFVTRGQLWSYLCQRLQGDIDCVERVGDECYTADNKTNLVDYLINVEFQRAVNFTLDLGQDYIDSCSRLRLSEKSIVRKRFGSSRCSYILAETAFRDYDKCIGHAFQDFSGALSSPGLTQLQIQSRYCGFYGDVKSGCQAPLSACMGAEKDAKFREENMDVLAQIEALMGIRAPGFRWSVFCRGLV